MEIKLAVEIFEVTMSIDEARQNGSAMDVNYLGSGGNRDFATTADRLKPARLDNDDGVVERRPARAVDEFPALNHEPLLCHALVSSLGQQPGR
jgi:hypothetical protein